MNVTFEIPNSLLIQVLTESLPEAFSNAFSIIAQYQSTKGRSTGHNYEHRLLRALSCISAVHECLELNFFSQHL